MNEDTRGKKRFLDRLEETRLAEQEINDFEKDEDSRNFG